MKSVMSLLIVAVAHFFTVSSISFATEIKNLKTTQSGNDAIATYDLVGGEGENEAEVTVAITAGNDRLTAAHLHLTGDFGKGVNVGIGKKIIWNATKDLPANFDGDLSWDVQTDSQLAKEKNRLELKEIRRNEISRIQRKSECCARCNDRYYSCTSECRDKYLYRGSSTNEQKQYDLCKKSNCSEDEQNKCIEKCQ
ncbi:MAG: hypothetical protein HQK96_00610 [Nitrospirae bacterium]|nr:hypothetical protein [Nitrospirota bacterium]